MKFFIKKTDNSHYHIVGHILPDVYRFSVIPGDAALSRLGKGRDGRAVRAGAG